MMPGQPMQGPPPQQGPQQQGQQPPPVTIDDVVELLRNDRMRGFRIEVETDSLVEADQDAEKQRRVEFVTAVGEFLTKLGPVVKEMPPLAPLVGGMLQFAVRGFKVGAELEELIEKTMANVSAALQQPAPPQPSPDELVKLEGTKVKVGAEIQKANIAASTAQQDAAAKQTSQKIDLIGKVLDHHSTVAEHKLNASQMAMEGQQSQEQHEQKLEQIKAAKAAKPGDQ